MTAGRCVQLGSLCCYGDDDDDCIRFVCRSSATFTVVKQSTFIPERSSIEFDAVSTRPRLLPPNRLSASQPRFSALNKLTPCPESFDGDAGGR